MLFHIFNCKIIHDEISATNIKTVYFQIKLIVCISVEVWFSRNRDRLPFVVPGFLVGSVFPIFLLLCLFVCFVVLPNFVCVSGMSISDCLFGLSLHRNIQFHKHTDTFYCAFINRIGIAYLLSMTFWKENLNNARQQFLQNQH